MGTPTAWMYCTGFSFVRTLHAPEATKRTNRVKYCRWRFIE